MLADSIPWTLPVAELPALGHVVRVPGAGGTALFARVSVRAKAQGACAVDEDSHAVAFLNVCTHMGCRLVRTDRIPLLGGAAEATVLGPCPCHGTTFDLAAGGLVVLGPATQNLPQLVVERSGDALEARLVDATDPFAEAWPSQARKG